MSALDIYIYLPGIRCISKHIDLKGKKIKKSIQSNQINFIKSVNVVEKRVEGRMETRERDKESVKQTNTTNP